MTWGRCRGAAPVGAQVSPGAGAEGGDTYTALPRDTNVPALTRRDVEGEFVHSLLVAAAREAQGDGEGLPPPHHQLLAAHVRRPVLPPVAVAVQVPCLQQQLCKGSGTSSSDSGTRHAAPRLGKEGWLSLIPSSGLGPW